MIPENRLKLSLIVIAYNEEAVIGKCLEAISKQTIMPYEVIVVDNNSNDRTAEISRTFAFVKLVKETSQGMIAARNKGFEVATGDIFGRIDADTVIGPRWAERVIHDFSSYDMTA